MFDFAPALWNYQSPQQPSGATGTSHLLEEDNVSRFLLEDGTSTILLEA